MKFIFAITKYVVKYRLQDTGWNGWDVWQIVFPFIYRHVLKNGNIEGVENILKEDKE